MHLLLIQDFFSQKYAGNKKEKKYLTARSSNCSVSAKLLVETPYFGGVNSPKKLLKQLIWLQIFFFFSSLAYKLVNLLVFEKFHKK